VVAGAVGALIAKPQQAGFCRSHFKVDIPLAIGTKSFLQAFHVPLRPTLEHLIFVVAFEYANDLVEEFIAQGTAVIDVETNNLNSLHSRQVKLQGLPEHVEK